MQIVQYVLQIRRWAQDGELFCFPKLKTFFWVLQSESKINVVWHMSSSIEVGLSSHLLDTILLCFWRTWWGTRFKIKCFGASTCVWGCLCLRLVAEADLRKYSERLLWIPSQLLKFFERLILLVVACTFHIHIWASCFPATHLNGVIGTADMETNVPATWITYLVCTSIWLSGSHPHRCL